MGKPKKLGRNSDRGSQNNNEPQNMSNKKRKRASNRHSGKKKRRSSSGGRYWIEDCADSKPKTGEPALTVIITRVELTDDHMHTPKETDQPGGMSPSKIATETNAKEQDSAGTSNGERAKIHDEQPLTESTPKQANGASKLPSDTSHQAKLLSTTASSANRQSGSNQQSAFISVQRAESAKGSPKKNPLYSPDYKPLPNGDCGDGIVNPFPKSEVADKYWAQRRRLFSRFDDGIQLDRESWYSVTPEVIANHIAERMVQELVKGRDIDSGTEQGIVVMDAFCGCGGNAIAFARRPEVALVVCVDTDRSKLLKAANNASVYRIPKTKIAFLEGDACRIMSCYAEGKKRSDATDLREVQECHGYKVGGLDLLPDHIDTIFLSPPWGGVNYETVGRRNFDLATCINVTAADEEEKNGQELLAMAATSVESRLVVYFLPRNTNGIYVGRCALKAGYDGAFELEQNVVNGKFKTITAYFGFEQDTINNESDNERSDLRSNKAVTPGVT